MKPLFHPSLYQIDQPQPSYWEKSAGDVSVQGKPLAGAQRCDVTIIGGGYTGLSVALHLAGDFNVDVAVLEAGHIGWGASGRNGGFCTITSRGRGVATAAAKRHRGIATDDGRRVAVKRLAHPESNV